MQKENQLFGKINIKNQKMIQNIYKNQKEKWMIYKID